ncbi:MAG TPA: sigma-54 dependent transcriptional regulator [Thermoanaerobaculia bacterium]|nr:sigma-54 dependent transcriptional regulator [Thermoanaerobaculia bacterium]
MNKRILIVDDDSDVLAGLAALLAHLEWDVETALNGKEALRKFAAFAPDVVLLDVNLPDAHGIDLLDQMKGYAEDVPVIVMSGVGTIDVAVQAMRKGAETFVTKPFDVDNLELVLEQVDRRIAVSRELLALKRRGTPREMRVEGVSPHARELDEMIARVAPSRSPILLLGESGSGKGVIARMIHDRSDRAKAPFVDLNCAGFSRELFESELFGHERGAFTDAGSAKPGLFEIATGGSVFLDEIGELELSIQVRLLKALEEKRFRRVGGVRDIQVDIRLIAATNRDLSADVAAGRFRKDLFYRLNVVKIVIPPLRERRDDIPVLAGQILSNLTVELKSDVRGISERAMQKLSAYSWPGNVRELRNVLERALLVASSREIKVEELYLEGAESSALQQDPAVRQDSATEPLDDVITAYVRRAVDAAGGNIREAARQLKVSPSTIYARLKEK